MAKHEFGIMEEAPRPGERYDDYEPWKYGCISIDDDLIEPVLPELEQIDCFWHTVDRPGKGIDYCGINLIPPTSIDQFLAAIPSPLEEAYVSLIELMLQAKKEKHFIIHYGL